ncbi:hypothetical protein CA54_17290 [Symmachiella macrocystis]|uniref:Uncharacterized protein n=1 Tax=Symmachiella macrocystis TaxID=2527985 RepID=A0A5C6BL62_9PLAN|nr:hypothetical protein [Symmachiella macrocystis]TWU12903.1 hypothetical protein CA54_17290 [Symmachiella macrocystis]
MSACFNRNPQKTSCDIDTLQAICQTSTVKATVDAIVDDMARRRIDLSQVTLDEMKGYLTTALRRCDKSATALRPPKCVT